MTGQRDPERDPASPSEDAPEAAESDRPPPAGRAGAGALDGFELREPSSSDWALETTQRPLPKELLDAMRHPDVPGVVLDAITRRSTPPPGDVHPPIADSPDEDTARYMLGPTKRPHEEAVPARSQQRHEAEDSLAAAWLVGVAFSGVVLAWLSFGLLAP